MLPSNQNCIKPIQKISQPQPHFDKFLPYCIGKCRCYNLYTTPFAMSMQVPSGPALPQCSVWFNHCFHLLHLTTLSLLCGENIIYCNAVFLEETEHNAEHCICAVHAAHHSIYQDKKLLSHVVYFHCKYIYMYKTIEVRVNTVAITTTGKSCSLYRELLKPLWVIYQ